jgi:multimeric flavodoxin WrbA
MARRWWLVAVVLAAVAGQAWAGEAKGIKIIAVSCSPRPGKTTAAALQACLDAAKAVDPSIEVELIELAGLSIPGQVAAGLPLAAGQKDDFPALVAKLADPKVAGILIGSPVYFSGMSSLCKAFLDRCITFRKQDFALAGKVAGAVAVGGARNGGQELTVQSIHTALLCQGMVVVGSGPPTARIGATLWSQKGDISKDEFGLATAKDLGRRVAEVALRMATTAR